jgi:outer membrane protein
LKKNFSIVSVVVLGAAALAHAQAQPAPAAPAASVAPHAGAVPTKVAIIHVQNAILSTKEGQTAATALSARFQPKKAELDKKQADINALREQLSKGGATMSEDAKNKLMREIDSGTKAYNRDTEDAQADLDQEQGKLMNELGGKMLAIIEQYATQNGFAVVLDVSNPQTSTVLWASAAIDITNDIVKLYDLAHPSAGAAPGTPSSGASRTATPAPARTAPPLTMPPAQKKK